MKQRRAVYSILYFIREGIDSIFLHGMMSAASVSLLLACLIVFGTFALIGLNINMLVEDLGRSHEIVVFIDEDVSYVDARMLGAEIEAIEGVGKAVFVSREEGLEEFRQGLGEYRSILEGLEDDNPLRDSYQISIHDLTKAEQIERVLNRMPEIAKTRMRSDTIRSFLDARNIIAGIAVVLGGLLCMLGIFIISNAVRLSAFSRREEIAIMRMVGATSAIIRLSFLVEGIIIGIIGAGQAFLGQLAIYTGLIVPRVESLVELIAFESVGLMLLCGFILVGLIMGLCGSSLAIRKYLKV